MILGNKKRERRHLAKIPLWMRTYLLNEFMFLHPWLGQSLIWKNNSTDCVIIICRVSGLYLCVPRSENVFIFQSDSWRWLQPPSSRDAVSSNLIRSRTPLKACIWFAKETSNRERKASRLNGEMRKQMTNSRVFHISEVYYNILRDYIQRKPCPKRSDSWTVIFLAMATIHADVRKQIDRLNDLGRK